MPERQPLTVLPARFELNSAVLEEGSEIVVKTLTFPHYQAFERFRHTAEAHLNRDAEPNRKKKQYVTPDHRQFNNALLACLPTLTHAFEPFGFFDDEEQARNRRALAVGTPYAPLRTPSVQQMTQLFHLWASDWIARTQAKNVAVGDLIGQAGEALHEAISHPPHGWDWEPVLVGPLLRDTNTNNAIGFNALPAILASMLHMRSCTLLSSQGKEIHVQWRKAQGKTGDRTGLFAVSQPFLGQYINENGKQQEGYFAYRLEFRIETQAGRYTDVGDEQKLKPWVFVFLTCQRYAHEALVEANYGRNISFLAGVKEARIPGYPFDETLVRLTAKKESGEAFNFQWQDHLPDYLSSFRAKSLPEPNDLLQHPVEHANLHNSPEWNKDEYLLVNATGYEYTDSNGKKSLHAIQPGYSLRERADVLQAVLKLLNGALLSDTALIQDKDAPKGRRTPAAMRTHYFLRKSSRIDAETFGRQSVESGIAAAINAPRLHLSLLFREADSADAMRMYIKEALFLAPGDQFPPWLRVTEQFLEGDHLKVLPKPGNDNKNAVAQAWADKYEDWYDVVQASIKSTEPSIPRLALTEIGKVGVKGIAPSQNIRSAVRSACARSNVGSQMVQTVEMRKTPKDGKGPYSDSSENRMRSAVLDLLIRQTGALMGKPSEIYRSAGIPNEIADNLDVIAFFRRRCNKDYYRGDVQYAVAVRLRANGSVEVMLPQQRDWISYVQAGHEIGRLFFSARQSDKFGPGFTRINSAIKLRGSELAQFVHYVLTGVGTQPTIAIIEAIGWRNSRGQDTDGKIWPQLANPNMLKNHQVLDFSHLENGATYDRADKRMDGVLAVIRLRDGFEVPHYIPNRVTWGAEDNVRELQHLSGFCDWTARPLLHYFSAGKNPETAKAQNSKPMMQLYKAEQGEGTVWKMRGDLHAARIPYRHPAMIEMVPFFVHPDFASDEGMTALCRIPHYLRFSPAWAMGNLDSPYPLHLGDKIIEDQLCILGLGDD